MSRGEGPDLILDGSLYAVGVSESWTDYLRWSRVIPNNRKNPRFYCTLNVMDSKVYLFGGIASRTLRSLEREGDSYNDLLIFERGNVKWRLLQLEIKPSPRSGHTCVNYGNDTLIL
jgi:hypothetical protein